MLLESYGTWSGLSQSTQISYTFSAVVLNVFGKFFVDSTDTHTYLSHTFHNREIWSICKGYVGGWYTGLCLAWVCQFPSYPQVL